VNKMHDQDSADQDRSPLQYPMFKALLLAGFVSNLGTFIQSVAAGWMMTSMSGAPVMIALVQASASLPVLILTLWAGALADNFDRRKIMLGCQLLSFLLSGILSILVLTGLITPWLLLFFCLLIGASTAVAWPATQIANSGIVPRSVLPRAVTLNAMSMNLARSLGPALGGIVISSLGGAFAFCLNTASYVALILVLLRGRIIREPRLLPPEQLGAAMNAGLRYGIMSPTIRAVVVRSFMFGTSASGVQALMPLIARDMLHGDAASFGILLTSFGVGAITGALASTRMRKAWPAEIIVTFASLVGAFGALLVSQSEMLPVTMFAMVLSGASWLTTLSTFNAAIQLSTPKWVGARSLSLYQMGVAGGVTSGSLLIGTFASANGLESAMLLTAIGYCVVAAIGRMMPIRTADGLDLGPRKSWSAPETKIPVDLHSGPIIILVEYSVPEDNSLEFATAMHKRAQVLRRDGAHRWSLARDLAIADRWLERYECSTWLEYIRLNKRRTLLDQEINVEIKTIVTKGTEPVYHRLLERKSGALPWSTGPDLSLIDASANTV
jgi:MFS family permease